MFALPDRHALLDLFDDETGALDGGGSMCVSRGDCDTDISDIQLTDSMLGDHRRDFESFTGFMHNIGKLGLSHRAIGFVLQSLYRTPFAQLAHGTDEDRHGSGIIRANLGDQSSYVDLTID